MYHFLGSYWNVTLSRLSLLWETINAKPYFSESALFHHEMVDLTNFRPGFCIINVMIYIKEYSLKFLKISFDELLKVTNVLFTNFCKTYKFLCNMWCMMCDVRCVMFQTWFFVRSWPYESRGDQKHPIWVISSLFNDIPKLIPGGSSMYTISCKAS